MALVACYPTLLSEEAILQFEKKMKRIFIRRRKCKQGCYTGKAGEISYVDPSTKEAGGLKATKRGGGLQRKLWFHTRSRGR